MSRGFVKKTEGGRRTKVLCAALLRERREKGA